RMAQELTCISYVKLRDEKMRQYIKENSVDLRELEGKLNKFINHLEADITRKMKSEHERASVEQEKQDHKRYEEVVQYQQELEQQLEEKEHKRQEAYEEFLKEKLMVDEITRKIYEKDQMERQLRLEKITATQRYIGREKMEAENRHILEFASYQQLRRRAEWRTSESEGRRKNTFTRWQQCNEMERVCEELCQEEQAEAARQKQIVSKQRLELQQTCQEQIAFKEMRRQAEKVEETFRQMMMAKFADDDHIEQMNAQKRCMKQLAHKRAVEKLLEDRRQQYLADKVQYIALIMNTLVLLKLHATKLLGYLPKVRERRLSSFLRQADIFDEEGWGDDE
uniref:Meiosis-specific nuclear structural protein 1 n=1 Tax=Oncorhynchus tshawytscha TaxID=74940 RepID=A0A8C8EV10_ONCTS